ncbi:TIR domain-containing protein [Rhizobium laguerreae]|uniref:TIR domain-containing protein n=1 Tax=Rhizobium laguerreae TaxID=1076926 RepID=UPI00197E67CD|nr:TIR domain-containing protein [Rhizobium laguerreae]
MSRMIERFQGDAGRELRLEALTAQSIVARDPALAEELTDLVGLQELDVGQILIEQNGEDDDIFFIISGSFGIHINGRRIGGRGRGDHVGEMAAVEPTQRRSATVVAEESSLVARLTAKQFSKLAKKYPDMYRQIARSLSRRLLERNKHVGVYREKIRVFIISSAESLPVARLVRNAFEHDPFLTTIWTDGVFRVANYTLQDLEAEVDDSDFAVAIAHADDLTESRGKDWPSPRDNVVFELGLFMGKLGRQRAILMEPREEKVKLPSDLSGITTVPYRFESGKDAASLIAPACDRLRQHIFDLGPFNG